MIPVVAPGPNSRNWFPESLRPMLATAAGGPLDDPNYAYEVKWDGMRALAGVERGRLTLKTRNGLDALRRFPELAGIWEHLAGSSAILDGEIVTLRAGRPDFWLLQQRIQAKAPETILALSRDIPAALIIFDILRADERWLLQLPWQERRACLERMISPGEPVQLSPTWPDGRALWSAIGQLGMEGVMAKQRASSYKPGARSKAWLKIKVHDTREALVCGWTEGTGARSGHLGSLLLGECHHGQLRFIGHVGSGFDTRELNDALQRLLPLEISNCPFPARPLTNGTPHWVKPQWTCEIRHQGWSGEHRLRAPVFVRWRPDVAGPDCRT